MRTLAKVSLKVGIFYFIIVVIKLGEQHFGILSRFEISSAQIVVFLLLAYFALLAWEIAERIKCEKEVRGVRGGSFILSFMVGGVFGIFGAYTGNLGDMSLGPLVANFIETGAVFGLAAAFLSGAIFKAVRSKRGSQHSCGTGGEQT